MCKPRSLYQKKGAEVFDYGNNIRQRAFDAGVKNAFDFPGFVPAYVRPLFCEGKGPFRWVALSGDPEDIYRTDEAIAELFPENEHLLRWLRMAREKVPFQGLPARICWLGYGERAQAGLAFNRLVAEGKISAPIVIGRDHLDAGSVASPNRETESMRDGSDAISDWPILNALINAVCGATWVSFHHGGGVGIGFSQHAGQVIVADGTPEAAVRLQRVLTVGPWNGGGAACRCRLSRSYPLCPRAWHPDADAARVGFMHKKGTRVLLFIVMIAVGAGAGLAYGWLLKPAAAPQEADLSRLRADFKTDLVLMAAEQFAETQDPLLALDELAKVEPKDPYALLVNAINYAQGVGYQPEDLAKMQALIEAIDPAIYQQWETSHNDGN